jgi:hypothetical protein
MSAKTPVANHERHKSATPTIGQLKLFSSTRLSRRGETIVRDANGPRLPVRSGSAALHESSPQTLRRPGIRSFAMSIHISASPGLIRYLQRAPRSGSKTIPAMRETPSRLPQATASVINPLPHRGRASTKSTLATSDGPCANSSAPTAIPSPPADTDRPAVMPSAKIGRITIFDLLDPGSRVCWTVVRHP